MTKEQDMNVIVENKLVRDKRDISVYHHSNRSVHMISYNSSITLPLETTEANDYLHIVIVRGPGNLQPDCWLKIPLWMDLEIVFGFEGKAVITHSPGNVWINLPARPPDWEVKVAWPETSPAVHHKTQAHITIGDMTPTKKKLGGEQTKTKKNDRKRRNKKMRRKKTMSTKTTNSNQQKKVLSITLEPSAGINFVYAFVNGKRVIAAQSAKKQEWEDEIKDDEIRVKVRMAGIDKPKYTGSIALSQDEMVQKTSFDFQLEGGYHDFELRL